MASDHRLHRRSLVLKLGILGAASPARAYAAPDKGAETGAGQSPRTPGGETQHDPFDRFADVRRVQDGDAGSPRGPSDRPGWPDERHPLVPPNYGIARDPRGYWRNRRQ